MGRAIRSQAWRHLCSAGRNFRRDIGKIAATVDPGGKEATNKTPHGECRGVPALPERPSSLEPVDRRRVLQGDRVLSAGGRERPQLRPRLHRFGRFLRAAGMEQLSAAEGSFSQRQSGGDDRPAARPGSRRSPHVVGGPVVASRLAVGRGSDRIQAQSRTESHLPNCEPLVRRVCDDHGET